MSQPDQFVIDEAVRIATRSPCAKSKRGAVIFDRGTDYVRASGYNTPPITRDCDGSSACRVSCAQRCLHAEQNAIGVIPGYSLRYVSDLDILHAKAVDGALVAGGGPSCWQCSRLILNSGLGGVWLYQDAPYGAPGVDDVTWPAWVRWDSVEFDRQTRITCGVY